MELLDKEALPSTVFACDAQPVLLEGLERVFETTGDLRLVGKSTVLEQGSTQISDLQPNVVLLGQPTAQKSVLQQVSQITAQSPQTRIILWVSELNDQEAFRALQLGARGVLQKTQPINSLLQCIRSVADGHIWIEEALSNRVNGLNRRNAQTRITPRERQIIEHICRGLKNREIADALTITPGTVKVHLMHIFEKTGTKDRFQLALQAKNILGVHEEVAAVAD